MLRLTIELRGLHATADVFRKFGDPAVDRFHTAGRRYDDCSFRRKRLCYCGAETAARADHKRSFSV